MKDKQAYCTPQLAIYSDLLSVQHLAEIFDVSKQTILKELKKGTFGKPLKIGRAYKVPKICILNMLEK